MTRRILASFCCLFLFCLPGSAQELPQPPPDVPKARVAEVRKIEAGGLLFAVRLYAANGKPLSLSRKQPPRAPSAGQLGANDPLPFSLEVSTLTDVYTGTVYRALPLLPRRPFLGPMEATAEIAPGGWVQMSVAFPPVPPPPEKGGKPQPYQLLFEIPELKISSIFFLDPVTLKPMEGNR